MASDAEQPKGIGQRGAYLMLGACLGMGPLVLRNGPGAMSPDRLKALIK
jgi:hypothetical protein